MADDFTQKNRRLKITTPLGPDALLLTRLSGHEGISTLFSFEADFIGRDSTLDFDAIVGKEITISVLMTGGERYLNGVISRFAHSGTVGAHATYHAQIVPWFWFLTRTTDCRIFQNKSVPDIVQQIFGEYGFSDFGLRLHGSYPQWNYCVQYRESDYDFIARLLEEEGIFYFFEHDQEKHTLVLADHRAECRPCPDTPPLRFMHKQETGPQQDVITWFRTEQEVRAGRYAATDYNFETPSLDLSATASGRDEREYELYDFPGAAGSPAKRERVEQLVRVRAQEQDATRIASRGRGYCRTFGSGYTFELRGVGKLSAFDGKYLLTSVHHRASESYVDTGEPDVSYENDFECIPASVVFRPERRTRTPVIHGVQTAVVVGPAGEEILVDKYGRVKVQFHWDREGQQNERSSCWVRVSQEWAGKSWGMITIPRIGQEVIVSFLEGDPDCPIITGRVYNAEQMPPYELPTNSTQSTIKSRSSKGAGSANFNEIRFEDKKGGEQLFLHAEKDMDVRVKTDSREWVGNDRHLIIKKSQKELVEGDKHLHVKMSQNERIEGDKSLGVGGDRYEKIGQVDCTEAGQEIHLKAGMKVVIEAGMQLSLVAPGGFIDIGPAGVAIQGTMVLINSGGAAGTGSPSTPQDPVDPDVADDGTKVGKL
jgi:type VI secretion system secreted protein VgrG